MLDDTCRDAGLDRAALYVTNAVKHFKWAPCGKRRLHQKPNAGEVRACASWWPLDVDLIEPEIIVCLGATAAQALLGPSFRLTQHRSEWQWSEERRVLATVHPSALLRAGAARADV